MIVNINLKEKMQERYKSIKEKNIGRLDQPSENSGDCESIIGISPEKSLNAALDSFDNLFCRRCLVRTKSMILLSFLSSHSKCIHSFLLFIQQIFDCRLHGCSQPLVYPVSNRILCYFQLNP